MKFACFGGAAAVADEAVASAARHRRGKLFSKGDKSESPSRSKASSPETKTSKRRITSPGRRQETDFDIYMAAAGKSSSSSSVTSSSALSTAPSLDSAYSSSSSSCCSRSSSSSSLSSLDATPAQPAKRRLQTDEPKRSPALGAAAVLVCLVMMMFGGRLAATLLTAAVLCFFPRQCHAYNRPTSPEPRGEAIDTRAVMDGFLARNRNK